MTPSPFDGQQIVYTVCPLPRTVPFLCENITENTRIPINHYCYSCPENKTNGTKTALTGASCLMIHRLGISLQ